MQDKQPGRQEMPTAPANTQQLSVWYQYAEQANSEQLEADRATLWTQATTGADLREQLNAESAIEIIDTELEARSE